ncbi:hypothetical protein FK530_19125 [Tsukamurella conjunctivitidis]|uniref:Lipoprotein n=1 Tax=Tsukamurella conjunctivitidis TaxID=2592068 RepID=A0A5C5RZ65_9ACTN|nr:hypothetical protein [Tsukamurella conjunctivitidis]TWS27261.1 hypothetical protein FK530_19125 [Tsukamurella conjunctivitidis]
MKINMGAAAAVLAAGLLVAACGAKGDDGPPKLTGADASLVAQADCGTDGVAGVHIKYGLIDEDHLIGRNAITLTIGKGSEKFDNRYGIGSDSKNVLFTITTSPTTGTCTTTLTDGNKGDVIAEKKSAGKIELQVLMTG